MPDAAVDSQYSGIAMVSPSIMPKCLRFLVTRDRCFSIAVPAMSESNVLKPFDLAYVLSSSYARLPMASSTAMVS
jgi:hypothetical protein